jgi:hypothetical protein
MLERYCLGETTPREQAEVEAALRSDGALAARIAALKKADAEIRAAYLPRRAGFCRVALRKARLRRLGLCAAAAALLCIAPATGLFNRFSEPADRIKGGANELLVYLKTESGGAALAEGVKLREGNTIQLAYTSESGQYGAIFSIDGRSVVTPHYPEAGETGRLISGRRVPLDAAYTLDDAPLYELFFFVVSPSPIDAEDLLNRARQLARDPETAVEQSAALFSPYDVKTVLVEKE